MMSLSPFRHPLLCLLALVGALLVVPLATAAPKDDIAERRAQAKVARAEMERLGAQLEPAIERYNQAVVELERIEADIAFTKRQIAVTKANLRLTQTELDAKLEQSYRVGEPNLVASILAQESLTQVLAVADLFQRSQTQASELISGLQQDKRSLARRQRTLDRDEARAMELRAARAAEKRSIDAGIAQQESLVAGLEDEIADLIMEEQARQEELRRETLAAMQAQEAATSGFAAGTIDLGGSLGVSDIDAIELPPTDGSIGAQAVAVAMQYLGVPYLWGGESPSGFDCSGLTQYAYAAVGVSLTHFTGSQWNEGTRVPYDQLLPGDLVFFHADLHHMGMYIGNGQMIHAPQTGDVVKISPLMSAYAGAVRPY